MTLSSSCGPVCYGGLRQNDIPIADFPTRSKERRRLLLVLGSASLKSSIYLSNFITARSLFLLLLLLLLLLDSPSHSFTLSLPFNLSVPLALFFSSSLPFYFSLPPPFPSVSLFILSFLFDDRYRALGIAVTAREFVGGPRATELLDFDISAIYYGAT